MTHIPLPSIDTLVAFESAARQRSFTRAAAELNLTQGAVSRQIRVLEDRLRSSLFQRVRHRVILPGAGRAYLIEVRRFITVRRSGQPQLPITCWMRISFPFAGRSFEHRAAFGEWRI